MTDPLVDAEGFPRSDVDVYAIRKTRHQIICMLQSIFVNIYLYMY